LFGVSGVGGLLTLLAWGIAADRVGERATATVGLLGAAGGLAAAALASSYATLLVFLFLTTALSASTNTATGRAVTSWFPRGERGFALGIRQTAIPLGGFSAAFALPPIVDHGGSRAALLALAGFSVAAALAAAATMTEGPVRAVEDEAAALRHPLRDGRIWRLSSGSAILVLTQATVTGFVVLFLESQRGFSHGAAAAVLGGMNAIAIVGRRAPLGPHRQPGRADAADLARNRALRRRRRCARRRLALAARAGARRRRRPLDELECALGRRHRRGRRPEAQRGRARVAADDAPGRDRPRAARLRAVRGSDLVARRLRGRRGVPARRGRRVAAARPLSARRPTRAARARAPRGRPRRPAPRA